MGFPGGTAVKNLPASSGDITDTGLIPGLDDPLEEGMANHSDVLAWRIPCTEEPGGLQFYSATKSQTQLKQLSMHGHRYRYKYRLPRWLSGKESACQCRRCRRCGFDPPARKIPCSRKWQPAPVFLLGKFDGQRNLVDYSQWGCKELDMTGD